MAPSAVVESPTSAVSVHLTTSKTIVSTSTSVIQDEEPYLLHRSLLETPHKVNRASGSYLYLEDGRKILDACGGAAVAILGHGNEEVLSAVVDQMKRVSYVHTAAYMTDSAEQLARCILEPRQGGFDHGLVKAYFIGSGSEANDAAMKCARQYWFEKGQPQRSVYIARRQAYHGNTIGAMSVSHMPARRVPYNEILLPEVSFVSPADAYHWQKDCETEEQYVDRLMLELEQEILRIGPEKVISFIGETASGAAMGSMPAPKGYWPAVRAMCDKYAILLHLDEIMCGTGRMGTYFAFEHEGIQPDIVTIGKGLGAGYVPIASMLINEKVVAGLKTGTSAFNHGHTYQAHPVSCAGALAVQKILRRDKLVSRVSDQGRKLGALVTKIFADSVHVGNIRGRGLFWAVEFMKDKKRKLPFERSVNFGPRVQLAAFELGVAVYPGAGTVDGVLGDHVILAPAYNITDEDMEKAVSLLRQAVDQVALSLAI